MPAAMESVVRWPDGLPVGRWRRPGDRGLRRRGGATVAACRWRGVAGGGGGGGVTLVSSDTGVGSGGRSSVIWVPPVHMRCEAGTA
jgi:hypothetical protein